MHPQIEFRHVLGELSVNRNDPCEVIRELISNSYDAGAGHIHYAPVASASGFAFLDDGSGLGMEPAQAGISPWEAFFSIGKSTKSKGAGIGYKCQGSKLCFASKRILVASRFDRGEERWAYKIIENPRNNLDVTYSILPDYSSDICAIVEQFLGKLDASGVAVVNDLKSRLAELAGKTGTLVLIDGLDTENFGKYFSVEPNVTESYIYNYIRFNTRHGDVRKISTPQGFTSSQVTQIASPRAAEFTMFSPEEGAIEVPFGFPYLAKPDGKEDVKSPQQISRLRDGRFFSRTAKSFSVAGKKYSVILAIDGNRRAHEEYPSLDRKGKAKSGVRLGDHRGAFISVKGIKIAKHTDLLASLPEYSVLAEGDAYSHYMLVLEGDFDLVTNRNALSKQAYDELGDPEFAKKFKEFLDSFRNKDAVFRELISRLRRESSENLLNEQIDILTEQKSGLKDRQRVRIADQSGSKHLVLAPKAGEEYLVGVLYASLGKYVDPDSPYRSYWRDVVTFSTQGIDSLALKSAVAQSPLAASNIEAVEYKYEFTNSGPFNHALAVVDKVIAWSVELDAAKSIRDTYTCRGRVNVLNPGLLWEITDIENDEAAEFPDATSVICLRRLIELTFSVTFKDP
ncbi:hypothetical protein QFW77_14980 [Luteimonas sp. RD2P54]|uniref:ATP-binding protein n=1 Tax=Luteimonas endophytica TaxID=3042023 RepID=A0ABT6JBS4_9GAMM|nr:hypothetical protein [Luteimonas endophytica]MDH5824280.1 hypothetical protein [Luteimonas endophytica]